MGWARAILVNFDTFAGPIVTLLYPLFASIKAIESHSKSDDQQWLTYWVIYSFVTLVEMSFWQLFSWIPLWGKIKFVAVCWLVLPQFNGAAFVYDYFVKKKLFKEGSGKLMSHHLEQIMSPSVQKSVQEFIDNHGQDTFENVVTVATRKYNSSPKKERRE